MFKLLLAIFVTLTATSMTAVAAWDRGGTMVDKTLLIGMSVVIVLAVHLLPAISRRPISWLVWTGCLICAIYGHLTFLTHASIRAGEALAQQSALSVGTQKQAETVREALAQITARPVAIVTAELAKETGKRVRSSLREEVSESKKAEGFRDELVRLSRVSTTAQIDGAVDPVTAKLSSVLGWSEGSIAVVIGLTFSMLLELIGALVWVEVLRPSTESSIREKAVTPAVTPRVTNPETANVTPVTNLEIIDVTLPVTPVTNSENSNETIRVTQPETDPNSNDVTVLKEAIEMGKCKATVVGIREFIGCSQTRAQELRRELAV